MTNRTVKMLGWGIGTTNLTAKLDGEIVFSGDVTLEEFSPGNWGEHTAPTLFTFEIPMDFSGVKKMSILCQKSAPVRLGQIVANYASQELGGTLYGSGPDVFVDVAELDSDSNRDPRSNIAINGQLQTINRGNQGGGTWHWNLNPGDVIDHDLTISRAGIEE